MREIVRKGHMKIAQDLSWRRSGQRTLSTFSAVFLNLEDRQEDRQDDAADDQTMIDMIADEPVNCRTVASTCWS